MLYLCPDCGSWHIFQSPSEMIKLSGGLGLIYCVNGCGLMIQVRHNDRLKVIHAPVKVEQIK